jgi:dipicolinate synthase subunit B
MDEGADVIPVVSHTVKNTTTRFGAAGEWVEKVEQLTGNNVIDSIVKAEPLGPKLPLDCMVIAPLTGNSMSKFANALTDSPVLMAAKATLRTHRPVVVGISTNDALGLNGVNLMRLMATKDIYFIPFGQDAPDKKPNSMVARMECLLDTVLSALEGKQFQPVVVEKFRDLEK